MWVFGFGDNTCWLDILDITDISWKFRWWAILAVQYKGGISSNGEAGFHLVRQTNIGILNKHSSFFIWMMMMMMIQMTMVMMMMMTMMMVRQTNIGILNKHSCLRSFIWMMMMLMVMMRTMMCMMMWMVVQKHWGPEQTFLLPPSSYGWGWWRWWWWWWWG